MSDFISFGYKCYFYSYSHANWSQGVKLQHLPIIIATFVVWFRLWLISSDSKNCENPYVFFDFVGGGGTRPPPPHSKNYEKSNVFFDFVSGGGGTRPPTCSPSARLVSRLEDWFPVSTANCWIQRSRKMCILLYKLQINSWNTSLHPYWVTMNTKRFPDGERDSHGFQEHTKHFIIIDRIGNDTNWFSYLWRTVGHRAAR